MSAAPEPVEPVALAGAPEISEAAQLARERLHQEIDRVRNGVEEMLDEQEARTNGAEVDNGQAPAAVAGDELSGEDLREELESLRIETRDFVKKRVRKSEKKLERSVREIDARTDELERRIDQVEADREEAEWRIHNNTEEILDGLLDDIRSIADRFAEAPAPAPAPTPPQAPVGRVGPRPVSTRAK